jgi:hypothetical protein
VKTAWALVPATALALAVAACGGTARGAPARTPGDQHLCAAAAALKHHPGIPASLAVISAGKNAGGTYRAAVTAFATAAIHGPRSAVTAAEQQLYAACGA